MKVRRDGAFTDMQATPDASGSGASGKQCDMIISWEDWLFRMEGKGGTRDMEWNWSLPVQKPNLLKQTCTHKNMTFQQKWLRITHHPTPVFLHPLPHRSQERKQPQNNGLPPAEEKKLHRSVSFCCLTSVPLHIHGLWRCLLVWPASGTPGSTVQRSWARRRSGTAAAGQAGWRYLLQRCCPFFQMHRTLSVDTNTSTEITRL